MCEKKYYICEVCGNIVEKVHDTGNELTCCMRTMKELIPGETDGKVEFHIPKCTFKKDTLKVTVGEEDHPMGKDHYIQWIGVVTDKGEMRKYLKPDDKPVAYFHLCEGEKVCEVTAYCNIHKLWRCKMDEKCDKKE